jgi:hypothetical protein
MIPVVWLASYPRSGNTMLRIILAQCFKLPSAAAYPEDFNGNHSLQELTGRIAPTTEGVIDFGDVPVRIIKTHGRPQDGSKAIYIVRNGIDATASFHDHGDRRIPIETLICGRPGLPMWCEHIAWWTPRSRPGTMMLKYEDVVSDTGRTVDALANFLGVAPVARSIPTRDDLAAVDGKWVRSASAPGRTRLSLSQVDHFWQLNGGTMREYGYSRSPESQETDYPAPRASPSRG